jgi:hypothetical protein
MALAPFIWLQHVCNISFPCSKDRILYEYKATAEISVLQGGSNMTGTDLCVNKPHCAAAVRPCESEATTSTLQQQYG